MQLFYAYDTSGDVDSPLTSVPDTVDHDQLAYPSTEDDEDGCDSDAYGEHLEVCTISEDGTVSSRMLFADVDDQDTDSSESSSLPPITLELVPDGKPNGSDALAGRH